MRNEILELSFEFALDIIEFAEQLEEKRKFVVANQILKSGTSIEQACGKLKIAKAVPILYINLKLAAKEAEETEYWLLLCEKDQKLSIQF
jgi:four helix bundle protein